jgi:hypothetical protein
MIREDACLILELKRLLLPHGDTAGEAAIPTVLVTVAVGELVTVSRQGPLSRGLTAFVSRRLS